MNLFLIEVLVGIVALALVIWVLFYWVRSSRPGSRSRSALFQWVRSSQPGSRPRSEPRRGPARGPPGKSWSGVDRGGAAPEEPRVAKDRTVSEEGIFPRPPEPVPYPSEPAASEGTRHLPSAARYGEPGTSAGEARPAEAETGESGRRAREEAELQSEMNRAEELRSLTAQSIQKLEPRPPRFVNVSFGSPGEKMALRRGFSLGMNRRYDLRIDIGALSRESIVMDAKEHPFPSEFLPPSEEGHWLEVLAISHDFEVRPVRHHLFLPRSGPSWVCDCTNEGHHSCTPESRRAQLVIETRSPPRSGIARLRLVIYYRNNLVQSQLIVAEVAETEREGFGTASTIDYNLTAELRDLSFLSARALNILTNESADGSHTIVFKDGAEEPLVVRFTEAQIRAAVDYVRQVLFEIHIAETPKTWGTGSSRTNLFDQHNAKDKDAFVVDLKLLAQAGWRLWNLIYNQGGKPEQRGQLVQRMKESGKTIQVSRIQGSTFVFPWSLVYDIPLGSDPNRYTLCRVLQGWAPGEATFNDQQAGCPFASSHAEDIICPYGFWGVRHIIELPPSCSNGNLPTSIQVEGAPPLVISTSLNLDPQLTQTHLEAIREILPQYAVITPSSVRDLRQDLDRPSLALLYFYCHGRRKQLPGLAAPIPFLEVGNGEPIEPTDITTWQIGWSRLGHHWESTPLVFINGCHTTELTPDLLTNFVDVFESANAGGVIGTEISIDQSIASEAAESFLSFFGNHRTVGESLRLLRLHFLRKGNLLGLAYTPYCSAELRLAGP